MIDSIGGMVVIVSDQQKAIEFYTQKLGFELKSDIPFGRSSGSAEGLRWVEVAPKKSQSTISLMVPNPIVMSDGVEIEAIKKSIGAETGIWFYSNNIQSTYEELKGKRVDITAPEKQEWGGVMSKVKDQDGNSFSIISSLPQPSIKQD
ncbi:MAG TPA: VOC family protein [Nitrososphaeraceae archaeon]|jgi:lactoylglutathione lyase|nr:VOC family protein [Nitrososphaeraceae archaeon]